MDNCSNCKHWTELGHNQGACGLPDVHETLVTVIPLRADGSHDFEGKAEMITSADFACNCHEPTCSNP